MTKESISKHKLPRRIYGSGSEDVGADSCLGKVAAFLFLNQKPDLDGSQRVSPVCSMLVGSHQAQFSARGWVRRHAASSNRLEFHGPP